MDPVSRAAVGAAVAKGSTPGSLGPAGFTSGGIKAGSTAAKMMSASAVAGRGGVGSGSLVSVCQSKGASGGSKRNK
ncbi:interferon alpha-inducible protein 27-like protein 2 isoform X1 [Limanda limanda]|uniref:interferon alpha-inducible protein 27-like protein 2 isoform X1 n=1 Tax=Limanda limanda TaxID=27771 RepID=UPI0029C64D47|nr:interferon alpha-inducible protein 27-like protein 2 isoform X1 [Limanda limanda]